MKYWNIGEILAYQRNFNFINGERSSGKTYTTQKFVIKKCLEKNYQFVYIVRTQDEKKKGILESSHSKVLMNEFKSEIIEFTSEEMVKVIKDEKGEVVEKITLGYCIALSEAVKMKKKSFPKVKYLIFDEYMLEKKHGSQYVGGFKEPELLLSLYHTIDREEDRVICFMLGNNTSFFNPYHLHKAFNIPQIEKGKIWTSFNVLFQWIETSNELKTSKSNCKFLKMLDGTDYGTYAKDGNYIDDNLNFIGDLTRSCKYTMSFSYEGTSFGVYNDMKKGYVYVSDKFDKTFPISYALTTDDHNENTLLTKATKISHLNWLAHAYKNGSVKFTNMKIKLKAEKGIISIL